MSNNEIIYELFNFAIVAVIFIVTVAIVFNIFCRKFKFDKKKYRVIWFVFKLRYTFFDCNSSFDG